MLGVVRFLNFGAAVGAAVLALIGLAGRFDPVLDIASHFAFPLLLVAVTAFSLSLLTAEKRPAMAIWPSLAAIAACALMIVPDLAARPHNDPVKPGDQAFRVLQFNVWINNTAPAETTAFILKTNADVVTMQEVHGEADGIPAALRSVYPYQIRARDKVTILSRWPMTAFQDWGGTTAWAVVRTPQGEVPVIACHYTWPTWAPYQNAQRRTLLEAAARFDAATLIVACDFNSTPWSAFLHRQDRMLGLERRTRALPSWPTGAVAPMGIPAPFPVLPIDHVYAGKAWRTVSVERGPRAGSDHYPVIVTLARKAPVAR